MNLPNYLSSVETVESGHIDRVLDRSTLPQIICDILLRCVSDSVPEGTARMRTSRCLKSDRSIKNPKRDQKN